MSKARKLTAIAFASLMLTATATAYAAPGPPTNAGNGGGSSGQCTGPAGERPGGACQSGNK
jgi:hypothetical protein